MARYFVYIITNKYNTVLYTGVTNNLGERIGAHMNGVGSKFTSKCQVSKLVYFEEFSEIEEAIAREKRIKRWKRVWKNELIEKANPGWEELNAC